MFYCVLFIDCVFHFKSSTFQHSCNLSISRFRSQRCSALLFSALSFLPSTPTPRNRRGPLVTKLLLKKPLTWSRFSRSLLIVPRGMSKPLLETPLVLVKPAMPHALPWTSATTTVRFSHVFHALIMFSPLIHVNSRRLRKWTLSWSFPRNLQLQRLLELLDVSFGSVKRKRSNLGAPLIASVEVSKAPARTASATATVPTKRTTTPTSSMPSPASATSSKFFPAFNTN